MKCVILQPSYIPWRGYFDQIRRADVFVFYDDVQYDKNGWRNRNRIKTAQGPMWLTVPVRHLGLNTPLNRVPIDWSQNWVKKHLGSIRQNYAHAAHFKAHTELLESIYSRHDEMLTDFTVESTITLAKYLGFNSTKFVCSSTIPSEGGKSDRVLCILRHLGATHYICGPSSRNYLNTEQFDAAGITLEYMCYDYPMYQQVYLPYDPHVSVLDLMLNTGANAANLIAKASNVLDFSHEQLIGGERLPLRYAGTSTAHA